MTPSKIYSVQRRKTVGPYVTVKMFSTREAAQAFMDNLTEHDPYYNTKDTHRRNYYRIVEDDVDQSDPGEVKVKEAAQYKHIKDCWRALDDAGSIKEMTKLLNEFPRWSGDWDMKVNIKDKVVTIVNTYYDAETESDEEDKQDYDMTALQDAKDWGVSDVDEKPWDSGKHFD